MQKIFFTYHYIGSPARHKAIIVTGTNGSVTTYLSNSSLDFVFFTVGTSGRTVKLPGLQTSTGVTDEVYKKPDGDGNFILMLKS